MRIALNNGASTYWLAGQPGVSERAHSSVRDFRLNGERILDPVPYLRAENTTQFDRGNQSNVVEFSTTRLFATTDDNWLFQVDYLVDFPLTGTLVLDINATTGTVQREIANCAMQRPKMVPSGLSLQLNYIIIGGAISDPNAP